ncbi:MAG: DUF6077 domain-containing protein [Rubrobacteraceae bacterium]
MTHSSSRTEGGETQEIPGRARKLRPVGPGRRGPGLTAGRLRSLEARVLLLALLALLVLVPLRAVLSPAPALLFLAAFVLFLVPGLLLSRLVKTESFSGLGRLPVAFALGAGIFGVLAIPFFVLHRSFGEYLWASGLVLAAFLIPAALEVWHMEEPESVGRAPDRTSAIANLLWVPFVGLGAVLAYTATRVVPAPNEDHWAYLAYIREYSNSESLGSLNPFYGTEVDGFSRLTINGWLSIQAAFSRVSGIDPGDLASLYLPPVLVLMSLLAFYWLARVLFEDRGAALLAGSLYGLFLLFYLDVTPGSFGGELVRRVVEDKFAARYLLLPVALGLAVLFLKRRSWPRLLTFTIAFWATGAVHPMVMGVLGCGIAALGVTHLAVNRKSRDAWTGVLMLGTVVFITLVPPLVYLLVTDSPLLSRVETMSPALVQERLRVWQDQGRLLILGEGSYTMHPSLVLNPVIAGAYLVGVPFLIWRVGRSLAAQLLLGVLLFFAFLVYFPPLASLAGEFVQPWLIYRLAWPIPLAALLTVGWVVWELLKYAVPRLDRRASVGGAAALLALVLVVLLAAGTAPRALAGVRTLDSVGETPQDEASCVDPAFDRLREITETSSVVLAPELENSCVPAYSSLAYVVSYRDEFAREGASGETDLSGGEARPGRARAVQDFFDTPTVTPAMIQTLQRFEVSNVLLPAGSPLNVQFGHLSGFTALNTPGERYRIYGVNQNELFATQAVAANEALQSGDPYGAIDAYSLALEEEPDDAVLAYTGLGLAYEALDTPPEAATYYEEAIELAPREPSLYPLLSGAYAGAGDSSNAAQALLSGIERMPEDVGLRTELSSLLTFQDTGAAIETQRPVVERFPEVPSYRVELGQLLAVNDENAAADRQFAEAIRQNPLSPELRASVALANQLAGRETEALRYYEQALNLEPDSPQYNLNVGKAYAGLSTKDGRNEEYFRLAERHLEKAARLEPRPGRVDERASAWSSLGDLYAGWDRRDQAIAAYERALEIDPEQPQVREKLEELDQA